MEIFGSVKLFWFLLGFAFLMAEVMTPGVVFLFFGLGSWVVLLLLFATPLPTSLQWVVFVIVSILTLLTLRKHLTRIFAVGKKGVRVDSLKEPMVADAYIGREIEVVADIIPGKPGSAELNGTVWRACSHVSIPKGAMVRVKEVKDLVLEVEPLAGAE